MIINFVWDFYIVSGLLFLAEFKSPMQQEVNTISRKDTTIWQKFIPSQQKCEPLQ